MEDTGHARYKTGGGALINVFAQLAGFGPLPNLSNPGTDATAELRGLDGTVKRCRRFARRSPCEVTMLEFLGFGLVRPFQRDGRADFAAAGGEQLVRSAVGQVLGTVGAFELTLGEMA